MRILLIFALAGQVVILVKSQLSTPNASVAVTAAVTTQESVPEEIIDQSLPAPTRLSRVARGTDYVIIRFRAPDGFRSDERYSHFRVVYKTDFGTQSVEINKTSVNQAVQERIARLLSGVLYRITVQCRGTRADGTILLSRESQSIEIRTEPPPVSDVKVISLNSAISRIILAWNAEKTSQNGTRISEFEITYKITDDLTTEEREKYQKPDVIVSQTSQNAFEHNNGFERELEIEPGATYEFIIVAKSNGVDPTVSKSTKITKIFPLPGPIGLIKISSTAVSIAVKWDTLTEVTDITGHSIVYAEGRNSRNIQNITVNDITRSYNLTGLSPGSMYSITIVTVRDEMPFGKESKPTVLFARTKPNIPTVSINESGTDSISIEVRGQFFGNVTAIFSEVELLEGYNENRNRTEHDMNNNLVLVTGLTPGVLYRFDIIFSSGEGEDDDITYSSASLIARTKPHPVKDFYGASSRGKILLRWLKPDELTDETVWTYEIQYHPINNPSNRSKIEIGNRGGNTRMEYSLDDLSPATEYTVVVYTVTGRDEENDRVTRSIAAGPLRIYTQPESPTITKMTQVTIKRVRIEWQPAPQQKDAARFYYSLNLTRDQSNSSIEYRPEILSFKINSNETEIVIELSYGARYLVTLTCVVMDNDNPLHSVVSDKNTRYLETWSPYDSHQLFPRFVWELLACGDIGRFGPNQVVCDSAYRGTNLEDRVRVVDGIQYWIAPITGLYRITASGAGYPGPVGKGATVSGSFSIAEGTVLKIAVGRQGDSEGDETQGGAGGTFVVPEDNEDDPWLVAGGAGSAFQGAQPSDIADGRLNHTGGDASFVTEDFGMGGEDETMSPGQPGAGNTAGGAGYRGISNSVINLGNDARAAAGYLPYYDGEDVRSDIVPLQGGLYVSGNGYYSSGGFGGGGSGYGSGAGGGGGYTGGGGGPANGYSGGGGSYIKFTGGKEYGEVENKKAGSVKITLIGLPSSTPTPVTLYLVVGFLVGLGATICFLILICCINMHCRNCCVKKKTIEGAMPLDRVRSPDPNAIENSVHVTDISQSMSGLYVKDVDENESRSYRKFSEVDTESQLDRLKHRITVPTKILESDSEDLGAWRPTLSQTEDTVGLVNQAYEGSEEESSRSTVSPVSSYNSGVNKIADDVYAWEISDVDQSSGSRYSESEAIADSEGSSLPPPPPPPPEGVRKRPKAKKRTRSTQKTEFL